MPVEIVEPDAEWEVGELTGQQKTVRDFAYIVFGLIVLISVAIVWDWSFRSPNRPVVDAQKTVLDNYTALMEISTKRAQEMFDLLIVKALLPVFATLIGVIVGRRTDASS